MPGGFPLGNEDCNANTYGLVQGFSPSYDAAVTAGATNTKGSWTQLVAATTYDVCFVVAGATAYVFTTTGVTMSMDIGIGAGGAEQVLIPDLIAVGNKKFFNSNYKYSFPLCIPAGTRISARAQSSSAETSAGASVNLLDASLYGLDGFAGVDTIGFSSASTTGTNIDPGVVANTKGAYSELVASTARDYAGFILGVDNRSRDDSPDVGVARIDIAIGAGGSETIILPDFNCPKCDGFFRGPQLGPLFMLNIPAGTRIAARAQANQTGGTRTFGVTLYALYQ